MKSVFESNIELLKDQFPSVGGEYTLKNYYYYLNLSDGVYAEVYFQVLRDRPLLKYSTWMVEVKHTLDLAYRRLLKIELEKLGSFSRWTDLTTKDDYLTEDGLITLEFFMEIIWKEIFLHRVGQFGLIAGSWLSGALLK